MKDGHMRLELDRICTISPDHEVSVYVDLREPGIAKYGGSLGVVEHEYTPRGWGYCQGVYFGGKPTAPWDMDIVISELKTSK